MEPFLIRCTTCKARLKVREENSLGQILPCPKCGSMVFVAPRAESATTHELPGADAATNPPARGGAPSQPEAVFGDAFEQIEQLLEGESHDSSVSHTGRWRVSDSSPVSDVRRPTHEDAPPEPSTAAESVAFDAGDSGPDEWIPESVGLVRRYAAIVGGVLVGTVLAVGFTVWTLNRSTSPTTSDQAEAEVVDDVGANPPEQPSDLREREPLVTDDSEVQAPTPASEVAVEEESPAEPLAIESAAAPVNAPAATLEEDASVADEPDPDAETPPREPVQLAEDADGSSPTDPSMPPDPSPLVADDGLASFAQWLSSASADSSQPATANSGFLNEAPVEAMPQDVVRPSRPVPPPVDVAKRLGDAVAAIEFRQVAFVDALRTVSDLSTIPITIDPQALGRRMISPRRPVNLLRTETTVEELLRDLLEPLRLGYVITEGHLLITTKIESQGELVTIEHDVSDLTEGQSEATAELGKWLTQMIDPSTWQVHGGDGTYRVEQSTLVVEQSDTVQFQVLLFCEKLRVARGLARRSRIPDAMLSSQPLVQQVSTLQQKLTLRIWREENLNQIAARIERELPVTVLVDWNALLMSGWSPEDRMRFFCHEQSLEEALHSLLEPMGLTFRWLDPAILEITSPEAAAAQNDVEFYPLPAGLQSPEKVQEVSGRIADRVGLARFQPMGTGALAYDPASQTLIVSLPQSVQREVQRVLATP